VIQGLLVLTICLVSGFRPADWFAIPVAIGFMVLMTLVIALGTVSTNRYEREQRARARCAAG